MDYGRTMNVLAIDTATDLMGVALVDERRVLSSYELLADRPHAVELPGAVSRVLQAAGLRLEQLDGIALDIGPGSFTGLRIGLSFVKALVFSLRKPVAAVPSLDLLAAGLCDSAHRVCCLMDAKQGKVYGALYEVQRGRPQRRSDHLLAPVGELLSLCPSKEPVAFVGDGAALHRALIQERFGDRALLAPAEFNLPRAAIAGRLGLERLREGLHDDPQTLTPMYLYPIDCTVRPPATPVASPQAS